MLRAPLCLVISVALLFSIGLLMVFNTTSAEIIDRSLEISTHTALFKQIGYGCVGVIAGLVAYRWGYQSIIRWSIPLLIAASLLLASLFVPGIGATINGARRWILIF